VSFIPITPDNPIGTFRKVYLAQTTDEKIKRLRASSGGAVTSLLCYLVEKGLSDGVVVAKRTKGFEGEAIVACTREKILKAAGSRWNIVPFTTRLKRVIEERGLRRVAIVGLPCQAQFLTQMRYLPLLETDFGERIFLVVSLFCIGTFAHEVFLSFLNSKYRVRASQIRDLQLLGDKFVVKLEEGQITVDVKEALTYLQSGCLLCTDYTGVLADISAGSVSQFPSYTLLLIRSALGEKLVKEAIDENYIVVIEEPEVLTEVRKKALEKIMRASKYAAQLL